MSQQNTEVLRAGYDAINRGDLDAALELSAAQIPDPSRLQAVRRGRHHEPIRSRYRINACSANRSHSSSERRSACRY